MALIPFLRKRVPGRTLLELDLERGVVEHVPDDPVARFHARDKLAVRDVVDALERAAGDDRVRGLVARVGAGELGLARVEEVRDAVLAFRAAGKPAVLFSETFGEVAPGHGGYYLATAFDQVWLQPSGDVGLAGVAAVVPFARRMLERLGLEPRLGQRHEYKSAANVFTEDDFTEAHRESLEAVVEALLANLVEGIAAGRGLPRERVRELVDRGPFTAPEALEAGLVDRLGYRDEAYDAARTLAGGDVELLYAERYLARAKRPNRKGKRAIALVHGVGAVRRGESGFRYPFGPSMGSKSVAAALRQAAADRRVAAIVFRVDSPGGSYVASDAIRREVVRARAAGKPVIASMGNVAASGGYFVSMAADRIVAQPSTLTGSIGVVGGKLVTRAFWERLGIHWGEVHRGEHVLLWSTVRDYSPEEWRRVEEWLDRVYRDFVAKAAEGRGLSPEAMHERARGRVWIGRDALRLGLVDELGGLPAAFRLARQAAGIGADERVRVKVFPERKSLLETLFSRGKRRSSSEAAGRAALEAAGAVAPVLAPALRLADRLGLADSGEPEVLRLPPEYMGLLPAE